VGGGTTTGLGITAIFDNRDHPVASHTGWYVEMSFLSNEKFLGSDYQFTSFDDAGLGNGQADFYVSIGKAFYKSIQLIDRNPNN